MIYSWWWGKLCNTDRADNLFIHYCSNWTRENSTTLSNFKSFRFCFVICNCLFVKHFRACWFCTINCLFLVYFSPSWWCLICTGKQISLLLFVWTTICPSFLIQFCLPTLKRCYFYFVYDKSCTDSICDLTTCSWLFMAGDRYFLFCFSFCFWNLNIPIFQCLIMTILFWQYIHIFEFLVQLE